jgi:formamidopyrimidine-DNA glycosylase
MPELPDLTVFSNNLANKLIGKKVHSVEYHNGRNLKVSLVDLQNALLNTFIMVVRRSGKEIEFQFSSCASLFVHLMLSGGFVITRTPEIENFKILTIGFEDGITLVVSDPGGLVSIKLNPPESKVPDALDVDGSYLKKKISQRPKLLAKAFLIDQSIVRGIGNAYADEILWLARISPKSIVGKIPETVIDDLLSSIQTVLTEAIEEIKKINPEIISGEVRDFLSVHNYKRKQSPTGYKIIKEQVATKTTYFTDEQILYV